MCRLMRETEELEEAVAASHARFFVLADTAKDQSAMLRSHEDLRRLTETLMTKQMGIISAVSNEIAHTRRNLEAMQSMDSAKELRKHLKAILSEQESLRKRIDRQMDAFDKANDKLLEKHQHVD